MSNFNHIMVDLETLGTTPGGVILSLGAVQFDIETGKTGSTFYKKIALADSLAAGLTVDAATLQWWMLQSEPAKKELFDGAEEIKNVMYDFADFVDQPDQPVYLWGNSARFDLGLLEAAYVKLRIPIPWKFRNERCLRTLVSLAPHIKQNFKWDSTLTAHNALHDCYQQIAYCCETWKYLTNNKTIDPQIY